MTSFVFSLTTGDKFEFTGNTNAVYHDQKYGPVFGQVTSFGGFACDLFIPDKANQNQAWGNVNRIYRNIKYPEGTTRLNERFGGNPDSASFRIK